jgi:hypothetical protein
VLSVARSYIESLPCGLDHNSNGPTVIATGTYVCQRVCCVLAQRVSDGECCVGNLFYVK